MVLLELDAHFQHYLAAIVLAAFVVWRSAGFSSYLKLDADLTGVEAPFRDLAVGLGLVWLFVILSGSLFQWGPEWQSLLPELLEAAVLMHVRIRRINAHMGYRLLNVLFWTGVIVLLFSTDAAQSYATQESWPHPLAILNAILWLELLVRMVRDVAPIINAESLWLVVAVSIAASAVSIWLSSDDAGSVQLIQAFALLVWSHVWGQVSVFVIQRQAATIQNKLAVNAQWKKPYSALVDYTPEPTILVEQGTDRVIHINIAAELAFAGAKFTGQMFTAQFLALYTTGPDSLEGIFSVPNRPALRVLLHKTAVQLPDASYLIYVATLMPAESVALDRLLISQRQSLPGCAWALCDAQFRLTAMTPGWHQLLAPVTRYPESGVIWDKFSTLGLSPESLEEGRSVLSGQQRVSFDLASTLGVELTVTLQTLQVADGYECHLCEIFVKR